MGRKHKHSKDKLYKTVSELDSHHIGANKELDLSYLHRRIRFDTCCLSLSTINGKPVGLIDDTNFCYIFDMDIILRFFKKYPIHPVTGKNVSSNDLIPLNFHKNPEGQFHCPISFKPLNQYSKIVANKKTGHVYSNDTYQQLNVKANHFRDLLTDESFTRSDVVIIQDPSSAKEKWNVKEFHHVKFRLKFPLQESYDDPELSQALESKNIKPSDIMISTLDEYKKLSKGYDESHQKLFGSHKSDQIRDSNEILDCFNRGLESDGHMSKSVTSTVMPVVSSQLPSILNDEQILYPRIKKKGYVMLSTSLGPINIELLCDRTPKTCHNFLQLASKGYYNGTIFHRLIKNFMIQGGDPTGTGKGGESAFGVPFKDEFIGDLKHDGRGIVAMANSGPNTNKSQFYIILKGTWPHLDGKHTIFGTVKGGIDTLDKINEVTTNLKDRPATDIKLLSIKIYQDPFDELEKHIQEERKQIDLKKRKRSQESDGTVLKRYHSGVGGYLDIDSDKIDLKRMDHKSDLDPHKNEVNKKTRNSFSTNNRKTQSYGNFSNW